MRFRRSEDELRYHALRVEVYLRLAEALRGSPHLLRDVLRNLGKMEHFAFYEGVEQGTNAALMACYRDLRQEGACQSCGASLDPSVLGSVDGPQALSAADMHNWLYGQRDTPLAEAEMEAFGELDLAGNPPMPMVVPRAEYAPLTLDELQGADVPVSAPEQPTEAPQPSADWLPTGELGQAALEEVRERTPVVEGVVSSPEQLDQIRDALVEATRGGWRPTEWADIIIAAMHATGIPAFRIDEQLSTHEGRAVLDQAGIHDFRPSVWGALPEMKVITEGVGGIVAELEDMKDQLDHIDDLDPSKLPSVSDGEDERTPSPDAT